jgi:hypothetical protein
VILVSQQPRLDTVSIDEITVDIANTQSADVEPDEIESITRGLAGEQPPTNPIVILKAARWWYLHGKGGTDPAFQWAIEWARHLATDTPSDVERFDEFLEYLVTVSFADERHELR